MTIKVIKKLSVFGLVFNLILGCDSSSVNDETVLKADSAKNMQTVVDTSATLATEQNSPCSSDNDVLPIRITVDKNNKLYAYNALISEQYFREQVRALPDGCNNARITFLYESDNSLEYIHKISLILRNSGNFKTYDPILMKLPKPLVD